MKINNQEGQTAVEYILLMAVVVSLASTVFQSDIFQKNLGPEGEIFVFFRSYMENGYRHGFEYNKDFDYEFEDRDQGLHPTYFNYKTSKSRFFSPLTRYPSGE